MVVRGQFYYYRFNISTNICILGLMSPSFSIFAPSINFLYKVKLSLHNFSNVFLYLSRFMLTYKYWQMSSVSASIALIALAQSRVHIVSSKYTLYFSFWSKTRLWNKVKRDFSRKLLN